MTLSPELKAAFRFNRRCAYPAARAIELARQDLAAGKQRYSYGPARPVKQSDGMTYLENPKSCGLRYVGRVIADCGGRNGIWDSRDSSGWFTDPYGDTFKDGSGLVWGEVWQLPGRKGESRYVAGYRFGGSDSGPCLDLSRVYVEQSNGDNWAGYPQRQDAAQDAARAADSMAQHAAEKEREYQTAWAAGSRYSDESDQLAAAREDLKSILAERRKVKGQAAYPALCKAIRARVTDLLESMRESRDNMRELAEGDSSPLIFWPGDKRLHDAFCEGAGLDKFPA